MKIQTQTLNQFGFFIIGFSAAFGFYVITSAAFDFMATFTSTQQNNTNDESSSQRNNTLPGFCFSGSTSIIMMANTFPLIILKLVFAFFMVDLPKTINILLLTLISALAFIILTFASNESIVILGIVLVPIGLGISDSTAISTSPKYGNKCLVGYIFGIAIGGFAASFLYVLMRMFMSLHSVMFSCLSTPVATFIVYVFVIKELDCSNEENEEFKLICKSKYINNSKIDQFEPKKQTIKITSSQETAIETTIIDGNDDNLSFREKLRVCRAIIYYFMPSFISYSFMYYSNPGLYQLIDIKNNEFKLDAAAEYRWYQFMFQIGGISGPPFSEYVVKSQNLWINPIISFSVLIVLLLQVFLIISIPYITVIFILIFLQGFITNHQYISVMNKVSEDFDKRIRPFALLAVGFSDITSSVLPAFLSLSTHSAVCNLYKLI